MRTLAGQELVMVITCMDSTCDEKTRPRDTVDLLKHYRDQEGWFRCRCGKRGYIKKSFTTQEGPVWAPFLKGAIELGDDDDTYQPFVFLVGDQPDEHADQVWFSYYKDMRPWGARLKLGYGPGGPPVLATRTVGDLSRAASPNWLCRPRRDSRSGEAARKSLRDGAATTSGRSSPGAPKPATKRKAGTSPWRGAAARRSRYADARGVDTIHERSRATESA